MRKRSKMTWLQRAFRNLGRFPDRYGTGPDIRMFLVDIIGKPDHPNGWGNMIGQMRHRKMIRATNDYRRYRGDETVVYEIIKGTTYTKIEPKLTRIDKPEPNQGITIDIMNEEQTGGSLPPEQHQEKKPRYTLSPRMRFKVNKWLEEMADTIKAGSDSATTVAETINSRFHTEISGDTVKTICKEVLGEPGMFKSAPKQEIGALQVRIEELEKRVTAIEMKPEPSIRAEVTV